MATKAQPYVISWPLNAQAARNIDSMFRDLYGQLADSILGGDSDLTLDTLDKGDILYITDSLGTVDGLAIGSSGKVLRSNGTTPEWSAFTIPNSYTIGDIVYASTATVLSSLADVATGNALISGGVGAAPSYGKIGLTTHVSGTLPVANGGTNITSYTIGDLLYADGTTSLAKLADIATGNALLSGGVGAAPSWGKIALSGAGIAVTGTLGLLRGGTASDLSGTGGTGRFLKQASAGAAVTVVQVDATEIASPAALTRVSDTNVTLTLGGAPTTALLSATSITAGWSGQLSVARGGTALSTVAQGAVLYASALDTIAGLAKDTNATRYLSNTGASNNPAWAQVDLSNGVTGDLPYANLTPSANASRLLGRTSASAGDWQEITLGTGLTMATTTLSATNALLDGAAHTDTAAGSVARGDVIVGNSTPKWARLAIGAAARVLRSDGTDASWAQVVLTTDVTGTLPVANGGTGAATFTANRILYGNGTSAIQVSDNLRFDGTTFSVRGFGTHTFTTGGTGFNEVDVVNTTAGAANGASVRVIADESTGFSLTQTSSTYNTAVSGPSDPPNVASLSAIVAPRGGGLAFVPTNGPLQIYAGNATSERARFLSTGNFKLAGTAVRGTTEGTNHIDIFDGTAPVGTLSNGCSFYSTSGEMRVMDAAGNATLLSPHDKDGQWIHDEVNFKGRRLRVDMERLVKAVDQLLGGGYVRES